LTVRVDAKMDPRDIQGAVSGGHRRCKKAGATAHFGGDIKKGGNIREKVRGGPLSSESSKGEGRRVLWMLEMMKHCQARWGEKKGGYSKD